MDATLDYSAAKRAAARPLSERINLRLWAFLAIASLPFLWAAWTILGTGIIEKQGNHYVVDLKGMGNFPMDPRRDDERVIPEEVRALNGKKVKFIGEMYAPDAADRVHQFQLVYSIVECCLGGPPKVQERVFAFVPADKHVPNYSGSQVSVTGTLRVKVERQNGEAVSVFTMDVDEVKQRT